MNTGCLVYNDDAFASSCSEQGPPYLPGYAGHLTLNLDGDPAPELPVACVACVG